MKKFLPVLFFAALTVQNTVAQTKGKDYTVDANGDVVVVKIVENLPLHKDDIYAASLKYLEEAYRDTKYKIVVNSQEKGTVAGEGEFLQFHDANYFPSSYFLNAPILLRVDAKDNRARISVTLSYYTGKRTNTNKTEDIHDRISEFYPVKEDETERRKLYGKAFPILYEKVQKVLGDVESSLTATRPSITDDNW